IVSLPSERRRMIANQASSELYAAKAELPSIDAEIFIARNTLNSLLGRREGDISRAPITEVYRQSMFRDSISAGIPAQLLRNRPDIMAAEEQLQSDWHMTQAARAAMYPRLTLTGNVGWESESIRHWFDTPSAMLYRILGGLAQPLLKRGELRMQRQVKQIAQSISFIRLRDAIISAQCDVSNSMMRYSSARQRAMMLYGQVTELRGALERARRLMAAKNGSYLDIWNAQTRLLQAEENLYDAMLAMFEQRIALYRELGGGWR
ncbi:MAG: TolC family protein, partial [Ruminococcus flavefaciens]|nr:TolC family protein [Ruminococcus flavefaciens]